MLSDLGPIRAIVLSAKCPEDVFGMIGAKTEEERYTLLRRAYHVAARAVHPDTLASSGATPKELEDANHLTSAIQEWRAKAEAKIRAGTYGDKKPIDLPASVHPTAPQIVKSPTRKYIVGAAFAHGDLADLYACTYMTEDGKTEKKAAFKLTRSALDNDLGEDERNALLLLYPLAQPEERSYRYFPKPIEAFLLKSKGAPPRRAIVMEMAEGYVSLADVMRAYPAGLDYRDAAWMLKRALAAIWFAHRGRYVIHGAVLPEHILVHPTGHGAKLVDWSYAVRDWAKSGSHVKAICKARRAYYPQEILAKQPAKPQSDLYMLGRCAVGLLGGDVAAGLMPNTVPPLIRSFVSGMILPNYARRVSDAGELHEALDAHLQVLVGKRTYRELVMPKPHTT